jgi:uncharacterized protein (TIGR03437 family)
LNPAAAIAGGPGFTLTITGYGFASGATLELGGANLTTTFVSTTQLTAFVPASLISSPGTPQVQIMNPDGGVSALFGPFTVAAGGPIITALSPRATTVEDPFPSLALTVNGGGFESDAVVQWNGSPLATTFVSTTELSATVPQSLFATTGTAVVRVLSDGALSNAVNFHVDNSLISSLSPPYVVAGGPGFTLTINGSGFIPGATLEFANATLPTTFISTTQLSAFVPAAVISSPSSGRVLIANPDGDASGEFGPYVIAPAFPTITGLNPSAISTGDPFPTLTLTINGSGFASNAIAQWNGSPLATTFVNTTQLSAAVPHNLITTSGTALVTVFSNGATSNALNFVIATAPTITSFNPASVTAGTAGFSLTVNGTGFLPGARVSMGGTLPTTYVSSTQLIASVPASVVASPGTTDVVVENPGGVGSDFYTYVIESATPLSVITTSPLPTGTVGVSYSVALAATGGVTPYKSWSIVGGTLPNGMSLSGLNGVLAGILNGIPTTSGVFTFTAQVTDSANSTASSQFTLTIAPAPSSISITAVTNAASYVAGGVSPGELITIFGEGLGPGTLVGMQLDTQGRVATTLSGTQVLFDGIAAPLIYAQQGQVSAVVPYGVFGNSATNLQVSYQGRTSNTLSLAIVATTLGIFSLDGSGAGAGAIVNQDGTVNSPNNPASAGSTVFIYATGEGQTNPAGIDGKPNASPAPVPLATPVTATIGGANASVSYAGGVTGLVPGVLQVNVEIPSGTSAASAVPIVLTIGGQASQSGVTLAVGPAASGH